VNEFGSAQFEEISEVRATVMDEIQIMAKITGWLTAIMLAGALALPADAAPKPGGGGGAAPARAAGGGGGVGGHVFSGGGGRTFSPHISRSFTPHVGRSANFATVHRGTSFNRSALRTQRLNHLTQSNTAARALSNANLNNRILRRNGTASITTQAARQGRFASRFSARVGNTRFANVAAHRAWRRGLRAGFVPWYGPVFWPYAYSDIFDYAFWPGGYDDGYWDYAYDDFVDGLFWGEYGPPDVYAYAPAPGSRSSRVSYAGVQELCTQPGTGITAWPYADIERKVGLNADQKQLLDGVRKAGGDAAATFKASCPAENMFPLTPPGRLTAMTGRLQAMLDAVKIVQPALDRFYNSLSDEQKERFNAIGPKRLATNAEANAALPQNSKSCSEAKPGLANLPIEKIADVVKPTDAQQDTFKQLQDATGKAFSLLQAACPEDVPITPPGRLAAMEKRLQAMVDAAKTVKPALDGFYASLSNEQKARFDRIGQQLAQTGG
jgi:LTXXQ motif family protein